MSVLKTPNKRCSKFVKKNTCVRVNIIDAATFVCMSDERMREKSGRATTTTVKITSELEYNIITKYKSTSGVFIPTAQMILTLRYS